MEICAETPAAVIQNRHQRTRGKAGQEKSSTEAFRSTQGSAWFLGWLDR
jgi:hypothetical protein